MKLTLMFREYCSLCHKMRDALKPFQNEYGFGLEVVDVDENPVLEEKYNELVTFCWREMRKSVTGFWMRTG